MTLEGPDGVCLNKKIQFSRVILPIRAERKGVL